MELRIEFRSPNVIVTHGTSITYYNMDSTEDTAKFAWWLKANYENCTDQEGREGFVHWFKQTKKAYDLNVADDKRQQESSLLFRMADTVINLTPAFPKSLHD